MIRRGGERRRLRETIAMLTTLDERLRPALAAMEDAVSDLDGWSAGKDSDAATGHTGTSASITERHALRRLPHGAKRNRLADIVEKLGELAGEALTICGRYAPGIEYSTVRCAAGPHEPWWRREWGMDCDNIVPPERRAKGLCERCRKRKERSQESQAGNPCSGVA